MRAPRFWWHADPSLIARLLQPFGFLYGSLTARRMAKTGTRVDVPVICIGNFVAGGAGKTPTVLALAELAVRSGHRPFILSRGYGGRLHGPVQVDPAHHDAGDVGDEPLLMADRHPVIVSRDRVAGARAAIAAGAGLILMDDGLQNPALAKDVSIAVVDGASGVGNGLVLPAGPLRAPLGAQLPHVDMVLVIGEGVPGERLAAIARAAGKPVLTARLEPDADVAASLAGRPVVAFAGIGRPEKFRQTLTQIGAKLVAFEPFGDHQPYGQPDMARLSDQARRQGALLVTTQKDAARLKGRAPDHLVALPVELVFDQAELISDLLVRLPLASDRA